MRRRVDSTIAAASNRDMNAAFHAAVGGLGKIAICRYIIDFFRLDVNVWDTCSSNQSSWPLLHLRHSISKLS